MLRTIFGIVVILIIVKFAGLAVSGTVDALLNIALFVAVAVLIFNLATGSHE